MVGSRVDRHLCWIRAIRVFTINSAYFCVKSSSQGDVCYPVVGAVLWSNGLSFVSSFSGLSRRSAIRCIILYSKLRPRRCHVNDSADQRFIQAACVLSDWANYPRGAQRAIVLRVRHHGVVKAGSIAGVYRQLPRRRCDSHGSGSSARAVSPT
jgi:hypothetical protein